MVSKNSNGENINHFNAVRMRIKGSGNLQLTYFSYDEVETESLVDLVIPSSTNREPTRLSNFKQMRAQLELRVSEIDESFMINRIIMFIKPVASGYPG